MFHNLNARDSEIKQKRKWPEGPGARGEKPEVKGKTQVQSLTALALPPRASLAPKCNFLSAYGLAPAMQGVKSALDS